MSKSILQANTSYSFSDYFKLSHPTKDIVAEFGYGYQLTKLSLPLRPLIGTLEKLQNTFYKKLPHISLTSEAAKREMLIAPILLELLDYIDMDIDIEYPLYIDERLHGNLDYFIHSSQDIIIVEAKQADLERGFSQLAVELIAMEQYREGQHERLYGAVTVGDVWRFGLLDRNAKCIVKDIDSFRIPLDLNELFQVFLGVLQPVPLGSTVGDETRTSGTINSNLSLVNSRD